MKTFQAFTFEAAFASLPARLDPPCLNEVEGLENPTAGNIAAWIWERARPALPHLAAVSAFEPPHCWTEYDRTRAGDLGHG